MKRCDPNVRAKCPDGQHCELYAVFMDGSECDQFNEQVLNQPMTNADRIRAMGDEELADFLMDVSMGLLMDKQIMNVNAWLQRPVEEVH